MQPWVGNTFDKSLRMLNAVVAPLLAESFAELLLKPQCLAGYWNGEDGPWR
jgi:hypothetical protein